MQPQTRTAFDTIPAPPPPHMPARTMLPPNPKEVIKVCTCGARLTREQWSELPLCGVDRSLSENPHELRTHSCGSTIAVPVRVVRGRR